MQLVVNMRLLTTLLVTAILLIGCDSTPKYTPAEQTAIQPCTQQGFPASQCFAAYQAAGRPSDYNWLGTVGGFVAGAAANHFWNKNSQPSYTYSRDYRPQPQVVNNYYSAAPGQPLTTTPQTVVTSKPDPKPVFQPDKVVAPTTPVQAAVVKPDPKPVFQPNKVVEATVPTRAVTTDKTALNTDKTALNLVKPVEQPKSKPAPVFKPSTVSKTVKK